jgi:hypothetical protein
MHRKPSQFPVNEKIRLMLEQLLSRGGQAGSARIPPQPSKRVIRDLLARRLRAGPLTVGEQMSVVVLSVDHTDGDMAYWESILRNGSLHVTARCAVLKALICLAEIQARPLRLTGLTEAEMESLVEPRLMHDLIAHLADGQFIADVHEVLPQLPQAEQIEYWRQVERCRLRAMISACLLWGPLLLREPAAPLRDLALDAMGAETGPAAGLLLSQLMRGLGNSRAGVEVARLIANVKTRPRRIEGLNHLGVNAFRVATEDAVPRRVGFALEHPEVVWLCGSFVFSSDDAHIETAQLEVTTLPPRLNQAEFPESMKLSPMSGEELYDELLQRCSAAQREGIDLDYPPLLVLSMLEGTTARSAPAKHTLS